MKMVLVLFVKGRTRINEPLAQEFYVKCFLGKCFQIIMLIKQ